MVPCIIPWGVRPAEANEPRPVGDRGATGDRVEGEPAWPASQPPMERAPFSGSSHGHRRDAEHASDRAAALQIDMTGKRTREVEYRTRSQRGN